MKNILLLTDFSETAQNALNYAFELFIGDKCNFYLLNVHKVSSYSTSDLISSAPSSTVYGSIIENPKKTLSKLVQDYKSKYVHEEYTYKTICDYDTFILSVKQAISIHNIDLIVMGTNGATNAKEVIFGSNTLNVIREIDNPVLVIPNSYIYRAPDTILFATEADEFFIENNLYPLDFLRTKFNSKVHVLKIKDKNVEENDNMKTERIQVFFNKNSPSFHSVENISVDTAIDCFVQLYKIDLTTKIINKESFIKRLLKGSRVDEMIYKTRTPLLIMHP